MESKLPKPSGLKRPTPLTKTILPTDRIKSATSFASGINNMPTDRIKPATSFASGINNKTAHTGAGAALLHSIQPLSRDLTNLPNGFNRRERAKSPELRRPVRSPTRVKLRRSRSACDIRDVAPLKRANITLAPIPAKIARFGSNPSSVSNTTISGGSIRPPRIGCVVGGSAGGGGGGSGGAISKTTAKRTAMSATRPPIGRVGAAASAIANKKPVTKESAKPAAGKRIPPYDFKARFNDLLEKHKALKEKYEDKVEQMANLDGLPEQFEESQAQLFSTQEHLKNARTDIECLNRQVKSQTIKIDSISSCLVKTKEDLQQTKQAFEDMSKEHRALTVEVNELRARSQELTASNDALMAEVEQFKDQLFHSNIERKELHNTIMDLRGNIRVFCRVRPPLDLEEDKILCGWNYIDEATVEIQNPDLVAKNKPGSHTFSFDHVFHPGCRQEDIFEMVSPLIQSALDGFNVCIFAYGQTGSGKTYTMDGVPTNVGVIPRTVDLLFDSVQNYKRLGWEYEIKVTFLEIYNEVLYDLLSNEQKEMEIRMAKNNKNDIYVSNITQETVTSAGRLRQLMQIAKMNRATAATVGNDRSSRSHAVTKIELIGSHAEKQETSVGSINLVDLAGSESPKTSIRMNETKNINRSLSELTNVILALLQKQDHIPYRNSKLTHLLMPSLGGNSKTLMFINVAPLLDCFVESVKSLRFAASVNSCKMAKAKRNRFLNSSCANGSSSFDK